MEQPIHRLALDSDMTIYNAAAQKNELLAALASAQTLELDLSGVGEMDTAGLQVLLLAKREAAETGKEFRLTGHSKPVREVIEFTHLAAYFGDPLVISAKDNA
jgi:anti-sigma B factor antagonist